MTVMGRSRFEPPGDVCVLLLMVFIFCLFTYHIRIYLHIYKLNVYNIYLICYIQILFTQIYTYIVQVFVFVCINIYILIVYIEFI